MNIDRSISGSEVQDKSSRPSIVLLTMHKAGSAFVHGLLQEVASSCGLRMIDLAGEAFILGENAEDYITANGDRFVMDGSLYGPFRADIAHLAPVNPGTLSIVHIRDPRDCLVSDYFSICFSHIEPEAGPGLLDFRRRRNDCRKMSVDEFCIKSIENGYLGLKPFSRIHWDDQSVILSKYENMVSGFQQWLRSLSNFCRLRLDQRLLEKLDVQGQFSVNENIHKHKRQITPGDYMRKLTPSTQLLLTDVFHDDLIRYGYELRA